MSLENIYQQAAHFELLPGTLMDLQINHPVTVRLKLPLVGYEIGKYIIVKYPDAKDKGSFRDVLVDGNIVIVRYLIEGEKGECFAFRSTIRSITNYPEKFIILNYPKTIENRQLRANQRFTVYFSAEILLAGAEQEQAVKGVIIDISKQGCGFVFKTDNEKVNVKKRDVMVYLTTPEGEKLAIPSHVCNSRNNKGKVNVGIKFGDDDKQVERVLEQLLIDQELLGY